MTGRELTVDGITLRRGLRLVVAEQDYLYGLGTLHLRIRAAIETRDRRDGMWVLLTCDELVGETVIRRRLVEVRVSALRAAVRDTP